MCHRRLPGFAPGRSPQLRGAPLAGLVAVIGSAIFPLGYAAAQSAPGEAAADESGAGLEDYGSDLLNPRNTFQVYSELTQSPGSGDTTITKETINFRDVTRLDLTSQWTLGLRADVPLVGKSPVDSGSAFGLGDADVQLALIRALSADLSAGVGARLVAPTGDSDLGSGKWQILPGAAVRYAFGGNGDYFEPEVLYDLSFAGNPAKRDIGNLQFSPTLNYVLDSRWYATLYPSQDIRINFSTPVPGQTGPLFLPFDASLGYKLGKNANISAEIGIPIIKEYPVYDFKTKVVLNIKF